MNNITEEGIMKMLKKNPDEFIKLLEKKKIDFDKFGSELDIARKMIQDRFLMKKKDIDAVEFVFWFTYYVEREVQDLIVGPEVQLGGRKEAIQLIVDKLNFRDKISIISKLHIKNPKKNKFIKLLNKVNNLRNSVAHGRFDELKYGGYMLSDARGQLKITTNLMNALLKKSDKNK